MLRHFARMHETVKLYREAERILREFKLNDSWYEKPSEKDGRGCLVCTVHAYDARTATS